MEYEKTDHDIAPHKLTFTPQEVRVMRAAYTEILVKRELAGTTDQTNSVERSVALYPNKNQGMLWNTANLNHIVTNLEHFAAATDEEVGVILELPIPNFKNRDAIRRRKYGEIALGLATDIRKVAHMQEPISEADAQLFAAQLEVMTDDDVRELWEPADGADDKY